MTSRTIQAATISLMLFVGACGLYGGFWYVLSLREEAAAAQTAANALIEAHLRESKTLSTLLTTTEKDRAALGEYVIADSGVVDFLELIERMGRSLGLTIETKLTTEKIEGSTMFETLVPTFEIDGSYAQVVHMLRVLEALPYQVSIRSVSMNRKAGTLEGGWHGVFILGITKAKAS